MKKFTTIVTLIIFLVGCAGKTAHPVAQQQPQDSQMNCDEISQEITDNHNKILGLIPKQQKTGKNAALGVAGAFLLVPLFFMDFSDAERVEIQAFQERNKRLRVLYRYKKCTNILPAPVKLQTEK